MQSKNLIDHVLIQDIQEQKVKELQNFIRNQANTEVILTNFVKNIDNKIQTIFDKTGSWLSFKQQINKVYPNFFKNIQAAYPELNQRELKHCTYLLIGLSVKEVCRLMFIAPKTVESARYRIRKKMNLSSSIILKEHLESFI